MEWIAIIISLVAAVASIIAAKVSISSFRYTKQMSKGNIRRQIAAKEKQIREIDFKLKGKFGVNDNGRGRALTSLDMKVEQLQREIEDLRLEL